MSGFEKLEETTRWEPGSWSSVVTPHGRILLAPDAPPTLLEQLWGLLHEAGETQLPSVLDMILASHEGGIQSLCDFAIVLNQEGGSVRIAVRGSAIVETDGRIIDSGGTVTWLETTLDGPTFLIIRGADEAASAVFVAKDAILQVASMRVGERAEEQGSSALAAPVEAPAPDAVGEGGEKVPSPEDSPLESEAGDHDGRTVAGLPDEILAEINSNRDDGDSSQPEGEGSVLSARCPNGHDNPTTFIECRECGAKLTQPVVKIPQPRLGRVTSSTGETAELDEPVLVGRSPMLQEGVVAHHLMSVPSPERTISRNHVLITLEGWSVLAQDLKTNNGTLLRRQGIAPKRLSDMHPVLLQSGDVLDLGDGVLLSFEDLP